MRFGRVGCRVGMGEGVSVGNGGGGGDEGRGGIAGVLVTLTEMVDDSCSAEASSTTAAVGVRARSNWTDGCFLLEGWSWSAGGGDGRRGAALAGPVGYTDDGNGACMSSRAVLVDNGKAGRPAEPSTSVVAPSTFTGIGVASHFRGPWG
mgnify:CR=1 FL=1